MFQFVPHPSVDHLKKMDEHMKLDCIILKYVKVPSPEYGAMLTIITLGSLDKKELYEVSISNFLACTCKHFKFMSTQALGVTHLSSRSARNTMGTRRTLE